MRSKNSTYYHENADQRGWSVVSSVNCLTDEVGRQSDNGEERKSLHNSHGCESHAQGAQGRMRRHL